MTIYVGNLNINVREEKLNEIFSGFGEIKQIKIMKDTYTGESRGFAFIDMVDEANASVAISELDQKVVEGKRLSVSKARPRTTTNRYSNRNDYNR